MFEWLGLVAPDRSRKEPVAVPRWAPYAVSAAIATVAAIGALVLAIVIDVLV